MDENKIIRVILEAKDGLSGALRKANKNVQHELEEMDKSFLKSRKGINLYEDDFEKMADSLVDDSEKIDSATISVRSMTKALREAVNESRKLKNASRETFPGFGGTRTRKGAGGKFEAVKESDALVRSLQKGYNIARDTGKRLDEQLGATKEIRKERLKILDAKLREDILDSSARQDKERAKQAEVVEERVRNSGLLEEREQALVKFHRANQKFLNSQNEDDLVAAQKLQNEYEFLGKRIAQITGTVSNERTRRFQEERKEIRRNYAEQKANIKNLSRDQAEAIIKRIQLERKVQLSEGTRKDRIGKTIGFAVGDFFGGIRRGKSDIRDLDKDLEKLSSTFGRLGFAIGTAFRDLNSFVNLRWLFLTSAITLLINVLTQLVVVLVSVASSAILAGAALGTALVAGIAEAIPVVGLLAGAFHSFQNVLKAVGLEDKSQIKGSNDAKEAATKRTQAIQKLADAHYSVKKALLAVKEANYDLEQSHKDVSLAQKDQIESIKNLAEARKQAARDIVDANLAEKDSALALLEAEQGILDAKEKLREEELKDKLTKADTAGAKAAIKEAQDRLKLAQQQGDNAEIIKASQQLSIAQGNLDAIQTNADKSKNDLADAQLNVKRAEITRDQAAVKKKRDEEDAVKARRDGIEQSKIVIAAEKQLAAAVKSVADAQHDVAQSQIQVADSIHSLAIARREEGDAKKALADKTNLQSTAQKNLNEAIANFSPAEKKLYQALLRVKNVYKKSFSGTPGKDGILAPILAGFTSIADAVVKLLTDPKILSALSSLAKAIGTGLQRFAKLLTSKSFKEDLLFFIDEATTNLPKVFNILLSIFNLLIKIGKAGAPIFSDLLGGLDSLLSKADKAAGKSANSPIQRESGQQQKKTRLESFVEKAATHLKTWLALGKAIARVLYLLINVSAPTGKSLVESATDALNKLGDYIQKNPEKVQKFFSSIADSFKQLAGALVDLAKIFGKVAQDPQIQDFALFLIDTIVPGLFLMIKAVGYLVGALDALTHIPILGKFIKFGIEIAVAEKALNKLFPISQGVTNALRKGFSEVFKAIINPKRAVNDIKGILAITAEAASNASDKLAIMAKNWKTAGEAAFEATKKFAKIAKAEGIIKALTATLPLLGAALDLALGPVGLIILGITALGVAVFLLDKKFHFLRPTIEFFWKSLKAIFNWIKDHWRLVVASLTGPIGVAVLLIIKHWEKIKTLFFGFAGLLNKYFFKPVYAILIKPFQLAYDFIIGLFKKLPNLLGNILKKIPGLGFIIKHGGKIGGIIKGVVGAGVDATKGAATGVGSGLDTADTFLGGKHPKRISPTRVLNNDVVDAKLIKRLRAKGMSDSDILHWLVDHGTISKKNFNKRFGFPLASVSGFASGGVAQGVGRTDTVPAMLTPGEWVLNAKQQRKLAGRLRMSTQQLKANLFGTRLPDDGGFSNLKPSRKHAPIFGKTYTLIPQEDPNSTDSKGNAAVVWFIRLADGTFGQVTSRDADKIQKSRGNYIPGYVRRNSHGFMQSIIPNFDPKHLRESGGLKFANGGIIPNGVRGFASGGVVQQPGFGNTTTGATVNQEFNVKTEGETDWPYVMRLSAITAQSSF